MKKLLIVFLLCFMSFSQAATKADLRKAVTSINVELVSEIIESVQLTQHEYMCYLDLAEEVVRHREAILRQPRTEAGNCGQKMHIDDIETPYNNVYYGLSILNLTGSMVVGALSLTRFGPGVSQEVKGLCNAGFCLSAILFYIGGYFGCKSAEIFKAYEKLLQQKYDDAVEIKQLIYEANVARE